MTYPEFYGGSSEDVEDFLETMEVACISNHIDEPAQVACSGTEIAKHLFEGRC